jgi:hypothetical protein
MGNNKGETIRVLVILHPKDLKALKAIRERYGFASDSTAVRFALRVVAGTGRVDYNVLLNSEEEGEHEED